jgi:hypothetical protein
VDISCSLGAGLLGERPVVVRDLNPSGVAAATEKNVEIRTQPRIRDAKEFIPRPKPSISDAKPAP